VPPLPPTEVDDDDDDEDDDDDDAVADAPPDTSSNPVRPQPSAWTRSPRNKAATVEARFM